MATIQEVRNRFNEIFDQEYKKGMSMPEAFDASEKKLSEETILKAYKNFPSFNVARFQKTKRKLEK
jgi:hypothetical protein